MRSGYPSYQSEVAPHPGAPPEVMATVFSPGLVPFALEKVRGASGELDLVCFSTLVSRWREALISQSNDMPPRVRAVISGHDPSGAPLQGPHLTFLPMASVGVPFAKGHIVALAAALPAELSAAHRYLVLEVLNRVGELKLGSLGVWRLLPVAPGAQYQPEAWTAYPDGASHWGTVTPVAFDRHPKAKGPGAYQREVSEMIATACAAIGLPRPREVIVTAASPHLGVPPAHSFPRLARKDGSERRHSHAILVFATAVVGPVVIGAGRYRGYGVFRPLEGGEG